MNVKKIHVQAKLWTIPGPFLICCILLIINLKVSSTPILIPLTAVAGLFACLMWKWRGVAASSVVLGGILIYCLQAQPSQSWFWIITLCLSTASAFVATVLCSEEAYHEWDSLRKDTVDHKQTLVHLNERHHAVQQKFIAENNELSQKVSRLQQQLAAKEEKQRSNEQLIKLARHEITEAFTRNEQLLLELQEVRQKGSAEPEEAKNLAKDVVEALEKRLEHAAIEIANLGLQLKEVGSNEQNLRRENATLNARLASIQHQHASEKEVLREEMEKSVIRELEKSRALEFDLQEIQLLQSTSEANERVFNALIAQQKTELGELAVQVKEKELELAEQAEYNSQLVQSIKINKQSNAELEKRLELALAEQKELIRGSEKKIEALIEDARLQQLQLEEKKSIIAQLQEQLQQRSSENSESGKEDKEIRRLEGLYLQLRQQFSNKSEILTATRRELFETQEKMLALQKEQEEAEIDNGRETIDSLHRLIASAESELALTEHQHSLEIKRLHEVIDSLSKIECSA